MWLLASQKTNVLRNKGVNIHVLRGLYLSYLSVKQELLGGGPHLVVTPDALLLAYLFAGSKPPLLKEGGMCKVV